MEEEQATSAEEPKRREEGEETKSEASEVRSSPGVDEEIDRAMRRSFSRTNLARPSPRDTFQVDGRLESRNVNFPLQIRSVIGKALLVNLDVLCASPCRRCWPGDRSIPKLQRQNGGFQGHHGASRCWAMGE